MTNDWWEKIELSFIDLLTRRVAERCTHTQCENLSDNRINDVLWAQRWANASVIMTATPATITIALTIESVCNEQINSIEWNFEKKKWKQQFHKQNKVQKKKKKNKMERKNGSHINMMSVKEICLFMVIIFSCSFHANGKHLKSTVVTEMVSSTATTASAAAAATATTSNEVNRNSSDVRLKRANELPKIRRRANDNEYYDDGYVMEDMNLMQQDQPYSPYHRHHPFQMQKDYSAQELFEPKRRPQQNWQLTKEVLLKQGHLKGVIRPMHPHTGLRNVNQYLGIPYAAAPIGNGRFMPPGLCGLYISTWCYTIKLLVCLQALCSICEITAFNQYSYQQCIWNRCIPIQL